MPFLLIAVIVGSIFAAVCDCCHASSADSQVVLKNVPHSCCDEMEMQSPACDIGEIKSAAPAISELKTSLYVPSLGRILNLSEIQSKPARTDSFTSPPPLHLETPLYLSNQILRL